MAKKKAKQLEKSNLVKSRKVAHCNISWITCCHQAETKHDASAQLIECLLDDWP